LQTIHGKWCREIAFTSETPEQLIGRPPFDDNLIFPGQATIKMDNRVLAVIDSGSGHATWVDGRRLVKGERAELKHGMVLTFGQSDDILNALSLRCNIKFSMKPSPRRLWRYQESPARIERKNQRLSNAELASYMPTYSKNHDGKLGSLNLNGLLLLHKQAGMQGSWFDVPLASGATVRIKCHLQRGTVRYENANTKQEQDGLLSSFQNTMMEFMNKAYAFVDGEVRSLTNIRLDLEIRARRTITAALRQVEGVLSVAMAGGRFVARRDPTIPVPSLSALQRVLLRDGLVTFEDVGTYKDDRFKSGDKIIPQNTNPLQQGNFDPVIAPFGTLGHFASTLQEPEMSDEREEGDVEEEQEKEQHYAITIGHVLDDDTT
jgi:hypothetical protein